MIGRAAAQILTLTANQTVAADVSGDGTVSAFDASLVGRFAAGLIQRFPVADAAGSDWTFLPPVRAYAPLAQSETSDFAAVLYGDVTGNWEPSVSLTLSSTSAEERAAMDRDRLRKASIEVAPIPEVERRDPGPAGLRLTGWTAPLPAGSRRDLTVELDHAEGILALDLRLSYDPSRVKIVAVSPSAWARARAWRTARTASRSTAWRRCPGRARSSRSPSRLAAISGPRAPDAHRPRQRGGHPSPQSRLFRKRRLATRD
jgi:hypothetical protein